MAESPKKQLILLVVSLIIVFFVISILILFATNLLQSISPLNYHYNKLYWLVTLALLDGISILVSRHTSHKAKSWFNQSSIFHQRAEIERIELINSNIKLHENYQEKNINNEEQIKEIDKQYNNPLLLLPNLKKRKEELASQRENLRYESNRIQKKIEDLESDIIRNYSLINIKDINKNVAHKNIQSIKEIINTHLVELRHKIEKIEKDPKQKKIAKIYLFYDNIHHISVCFTLVLTIIFIISTIGVDPILSLLKSIDNICLNLVLFVLIILGSILSYIGKILDLIITKSIESLIKCLFS